MKSSGEFREGIAIREPSVIRKQGDRYEKPTAPVPSRQVHGYFRPNPVLPALPTCAGEGECRPSRKGESGGQCNFGPVRALPASYWAIWACTVSNGIGGISPQSETPMDPNRLAAPSCGPPVARYLMLTLDEKEECSRRRWLLAALPGGCGSSPSTQLPAPHLCPAKCTSV